MDPRLLRSAAVMASRTLPGPLNAAAEDSLASRLLEEFAFGRKRLNIWSPSPALPDLPHFLARSGIAKLGVGADDPAAAAQADRVLRHCSGIRSLVCLDGFSPSYWPPSLRALSLRHLAAFERSAGDDDPVVVGDATVASQHLQLVRLQNAAGLQQLKIHTGAVCNWPASLHCALPASLQTVRVKIVAEDAECIVDLSAFTAAAGCGAELHVKVCQATDEDEPVLEVLSALTALCSISSLQVDCNTSLTRIQALCSLVGRLNVNRFTVSLEPFHSITFLRGVHDLTADLPTYSYMHGKSHAHDGPPFPWHALAGPGMRCLGSAKFLLEKFAVESCTGVPFHATQWALVIWIRNLRAVEGLPLECFREEAPGKHVWRNAAARDITL